MAFKNVYENIQRVTPGPFGKNMSRTTDSYTKSEVDSKLAEERNVSNELYATKTQLSSDFDVLNNNIQTKAEKQQVDALDVSVNDIQKTLNLFLEDAPASLDTVKEIADAIAQGGEDVSTLMGVVETKADKTQVNALESDIQLKADKTQVITLDASVKNLESTIILKADKLYVDSMDSSILDQSKSYTDEKLNDINFSNIKGTENVITSDKLSSFEYQSKTQVDSAVATETQRATKVEQKLQEDLTYVADTVIPEMNTNTAKALDSKVSWDESKSVISIPKNGSISAARDESFVEGGVLLAQRSYDGSTFVTEVGTTKNNLTLNALERPQVDIKSQPSVKMAFISDLDKLKVTCDVQIPIRTLKSKIYEQDEILKWFGVKDIPELKTLISRRHLDLLLNVTYSYLPHIYRIPIQYIAFESANQVKIVTIGLDTSNDEPSKYTILMNLDGTVIDSSSNVQLTIDKLV